MRAALPIVLTLLAAPAFAVDFRTLVGHGGPVMATEISADGTHALTASFDNSVGYWDLRNEDVVWLEGHSAAVKTATFLGNGKAASGGDDFSVRIWDLETGKSLHDMTGHAGQVSGLDISPDGRTLASASWDGTIGLWDVATGGRIAFLKGHHGAVNDVVFGTDNTLFSASADGSIRVWDTEKKAEALRLVNHGFGVNTLALSGDWLAYGAVDGGTRIIDPSTGAEIADLTAGRRPILALAVSPNGDALSVGDGEGYAMSIDTRSWRITADFKASGKGPVWALSYTADGKSLLGGGIDDTAVIWPVAAALDAPVMGTTPPAFLSDPAAMSNGERQFRRKCSICHSLADDGIRRAGPTLSGLFGRPAGSIAGYAYSDTVQDLTLSWDEISIDALFEVGPDGYIPGSKMPQQRITRPEDRQDLIEFLKDNT